ncbi:hypothetical protein [Paracoccus suum]|uniref:hypothetical protein n=1 Tax=Paracoccus suum TaxID=2259340 RepID=UPI0013B051D0|nr:hypothetical protein [Paracoccus suum]
MASKPDKSDKSGTDEDEHTLTNEYEGDAERDGIPANGTRPVRDQSPEGVEGPPPRTV